VQFAAAARNCSAFCCTELSNPIQRSEENGQFPCLRIHGTQTAVSMHVSRKSLARLAADRESRSDSLSEVAPAFICAGPGVLAGSSVPPPPGAANKTFNFSRFLVLVLVIEKVASGIAFRAQVRSTRLCASNWVPKQLTAGSGTVRSRQPSEPVSLPCCTESGTAFSVLLHPGGNSPVHTAGW